MMLLPTEHTVATLHVSGTCEVAGLLGLQQGNASGLTMQSIAHNKEVHDLRIQLCLWISAICTLFQCQSFSGLVGIEVVSQARPTSAREGRVW